MFAFFSRSPLYQLGVVGLVIFSALFLAGFTTPNWLEVTQYTNAEINQGLWVNCVHDFGNSTDCVYIGINSNQFGWFHATRALQTMGLLVLMGACLYGFIVNCCCSKNRRVARTLEILAIVGGVLAFAGAMVFVAFYHKDHASNISLSWSAYLASVGSAVTIVAGIVIAVSNMRHNNVVV